ncbi:Uma2 family endonuclease [Methylothermus subterraneus]
MAASVYPRRHRITTAEFQRMVEAGVFAEDDRLELIEGEIFEMAPVGARHAECVSRLVRILVKGSRSLVRVQDPICLSEESQPQPDIAVVKDRNYAQAHPRPQDVLLLIEVADTSLTYDRTVKLPLYARYAIPEVWLVDLTQNQIEAYRQPQPQGYGQKLVAKPGEGIKAVLDPQIQVAVAEVLS